MRPGSVIVDLAAETGGNCELTEPGETVVREDVTIVGSSTCRPGCRCTRARCTRATSAPCSSTWCTDGELVIDLDDEINADAIITHDGRVTTRLLQTEAA